MPRAAGRGGAGRDRPGTLVVLALCRRGGGCGIVRLGREGGADEREGQGRRRTECGSNATPRTVFGEGLTGHEVLLVRGESTRPGRRIRLTLVVFHRLPRWLFESLPAPHSTASALTP